MRPPSSAAPGRLRSAPAALLALAVSLRAAVTLAAPPASLVVSAAPNLAVPDGNTSGTFSLINIPPIGGPAYVTDVNVTLNLSGAGPGGGWNGDLFLMLSHGGTASVLLNRPGRSAGDPFGYAGNGLASVTFDDSAAAGDVHRYQTTLGGPLAPGQPLTGAWQPDARLTAPELVSDGDHRTAFLGTFERLRPDGEWFLYLADLSPGAGFRLDSWEINLSFVSEIPEPRAGLIGAAALTLALAAAARFRHRARHAPTVGGPRSR